MASHESTHRIGAFHESSAPGVPATRRRKSAGRTVRSRRRNSTSPDTGAETAPLSQLAARLLGPPKDLFGQDRLFQRLQREATAEFQPRGISEHALVAALVTDFIELSNVRRMIASLQQPHLDQHTRVQWAEVRRSRKVMKLIDLARRHREGLACSPAQVVRIAEMIALAARSERQYLKQEADDEAQLAAEALAMQESKAAGDQEIASNATDSPAPSPPKPPPTPKKSSTGPVPPGEPDSYEEELRRVKQCMKIVEPIWDTISDTGKLAELFSTSRKIRGPLWQAIEAILNELAILRGTSPHYRKEVDAKIRARQDAITQGLARDPGGLTQLRKLQTEIERAIAFKKKLLTASQE